MIKPAEINAAAGKTGVRDTQIEKDYVIAWILFGISKNELLKKELAFKGGTVLKKAYFPDYRFSEDLDFTFVETDFDTSKFKAEFQKILEWVYNESRIKLEIKEDTTHVTGNYNFYITYTGPLGGIGANKDIKVDIASDELICNKLELRKIIHSYSDLPDFGMLCYSITEIISEKMRSLMQRTAPRDIYDLWFQFENEGLDIQDYVYCFIDKAKIKGKDPTKFVAEVLKKEKIFQTHWNTHLANQMSEVPEFSVVWRQLAKHWKQFEKIIGK